MRLSRNIVATSIATLVSVASSASIAFAHGGMASPGELGQPLALSAALAFGCYWVVVLWPSSKRDETSTRHKKAPKRRRRATSGGQGGLGVDSFKVLGRRNDG